MTENEKVGGGRFHRRGVNEKHADESFVFPFFAESQKEKLLSLWIFSLV